MKFDDGTVKGFFCHVSCPRSGGTFLWQYLQDNFEGKGWIAQPSKELLDANTAAITPHESICCGELIKLGLKVIHLVRDKKDVIYSMKRYEKLLSVAEKYIFNFYYDREKYDSMTDDEKYDLIYDLHVKNATIYRGYPNYLEITYKDLCLNTDETLKKIEKFIGLEFSTRLNIEYSTHGGD